MDDSPVFSQPTLAEVQARFEDWRKNKKHRCRIPQYLWTAAVRLNPEHSLHKISTALSLSYVDLKKRIQADKTPAASPSPDFIPMSLLINSIFQNSYTLYGIARHRYVPHVVYGDCR
jgi:hypothetical protein